jgi:hypothetical protein
MMDRLYERAKRLAVMKVRSGMTLSELRDFYGLEGKERMDEIFGKLKKMWSEWKAEREAKKKDKEWEKLFRGVPRSRVMKWWIHFDDPREAYEWWNYEFEPHEAARWASLGFSPSEAAIWRDRGFDPYQAKNQLMQKGIKSKKKPEKGKVKGKFSQKGVRRVKK